MCVWGGGSALPVGGFLLIFFFSPLPSPPLSVTFAEAVSKDCEEEAQRAADWRACCQDRRQAAEEGEQEARQARLDRH